MVFKLGFSIIHDLSIKHIVYCRHIYKYTLAIKHGIDSNSTFCFKALQNTDLH